ncbi:PASTA domain-containing protein [Neptuniibacter pectenicola]|uniref:PASTA domain-containing protein n=1 Tax=Neptuniibacter pectenicola TaxID=1806669 RepID=UPI00082A718A|nr:PASTA domain-containing protein [Neptuniibacter pectenicola]
MSQKNIFQDVLAAPLGDMVAEIGTGIANAQYAIDARTLENMKEIYRSDDETITELRNIGYRPTWYVIPEATAEINMALSLRQTLDSNGKTTTELQGTTVDASYQNQYDFNVQASSKLTIKFLPVPAPTQVDDLNIVPNIIGQPLATAKVLLQRLGISYNFSPKNVSDSKIVTTTDPQAGELIEADQVLTLKI